MTLAKFSELIPKEIRGKRAPSTIAIWHKLHQYISEAGQGHRFDAKLQAHVRDGTGRYVTELALQRHLRDMKQVGLLSGHRIVRGGSRNLLLKMLREIEPSVHKPDAGLFMLYTLPGMRPNLKQKVAKSKKGPKS